MRAAVIALGVLLAACGGKAKPATPAATDPKVLAAELASEVAEMAYVVHTYRDDCPQLARGLRGLFARMRDSIATAHRVQLDDALSRQLVTEMRGYDAVTREHTRAIDADFTASATCAHDREVREVLMSMPTL